MPSQIKMIGKSLGSVFKSLAKAKGPKKEASLIRQMRKDPSMGDTEGEKPFLWNQLLKWQAIIKRPLHTVLMRI